MLTITLSDVPIDSHIAELRVVGTSADENDAAELLAADWAIAAGADASIEKDSEHLARFADCIVNAVRRCGSVTIKYDDFDDE